MDLGTSAGFLGGTSGDYRDPAISPEGAPTTTTPLSDEQRAAHEALVAEWNDKLEGKSAEEIMDWVGAHVTGKIAVTMSMQDTVLAELAEGRLQDAELVFLDTGFHFDETIETRDKVAERYQLPLTNVLPVLSREEQDETYGPRLYSKDPAACCRMRKVEPLAVHLTPYAGWVTGLRRADGPTRANAPALSLDATGRLKISPLVTWSLEDTERFIDERDLIIHPLTRQGYPSIGCATCTLPVADGEDPRAGRWAGNAKTECGLHS